MNYQEFIDEIVTFFKENLGEGLDVYTQPVLRNNGVTLDGLIIYNPNLNISPTFYLNPFYHQYLDGMDLDEIKQDILLSYQAHLPKEDFDVSIYTDYDKVSEHIIMKLINYQKNIDLLQDLPHIQYLDMAIIFQCMLEMESNGFGTITIHNEQLNMWGIDFECLYKTAKRNTPYLLPYELNNIMEFLPEFVKNEGYKQDSSVPQMLVLTNQKKTNGATVLLYDNVLEEIAQTYHQDLILLPSSIHEVLLIPVDNSENIDYFTSLVQEVNENELLDEEVLSDHAYYYSRTKKKLIAS